MFLQPQLIFPGEGLTQLGGVLQNGVQYATLPLDPAFLAGTKQAIE